MNIRELVSPDKNASLESEVLSRITGHRIRRLHSVFSTRLIRIYRQVGLNITPVQGGILFLIDENPGLTQIALARLLKVEAPTVYQSLSPLVDRGLVERNRSVGDARAVALFLSEQGQSALAQVRTISRENEALLLGKLSDNEQQQLGLLLDKALSGAEGVVESEAE